MSNEKEYDLEVKIDWDGGTGEIEEDAFTTNLPEGLTEEHFDQVDSYRGQFAAAVAEGMLDVAEDHFKDSENDLSIVDYSMGGQATLSMTMGNDYHLVTAIEVAAGDALDIVQTKAKEIYLNQVTSDSDDE